MPMGMMGARMRMTRRILRTGVGMIGRKEKMRVKIRGRGGGESGSCERRHGNDHALVLLTVSSSIEGDCDTVPSEGVGSFGFSGVRSRTIGFWRNLGRGLG